MQSVDCIASIYYILYVRGGLEREHCEDRRQQS